jgi:hypothetical protein
MANNKVNIWEKIDDLIGKEGANINVSLDSRSLAYLGLVLLITTTAGFVIGNLLTKKL